MFSELNVMDYEKGQLIQTTLEWSITGYMNLVCFNNHVSHVLYSSVDLIVGYMTYEVPPPVQ